MLKNMHNLEWRGLRLRTDNRGKIMRRTRQLIENKLLEQWEQEWQNTNKGTVTTMFFPNIASRMRIKHLKPNYYITQFLTGHGNFAQKLNYFGRSEDDKCECGDIEDSNHTLFFCRRWEDIRRIWKESFPDTETRWPPDHFAIMKKSRWRLFEEVDHAILKIKEET